MSSGLSAEVLKVFGGEEAYVQAKANYMKALAYDHHRQIVNYQSCKTSASTPSSFVTRSTACDVFSLSTTVWISPLGSSKEERFSLLSRGSRRVPSVSPGVSNKIRLVKVMPSQLSSASDELKTRHVISEMLIAERDEFLKKLREVTHSKSVILHNAAGIIQKYYRRHFVLSNMRSIKRDQATLKIERAKYVKLMLETKGVDVTLGYQRRTFRQRRITAATRIQCLFRSYLATHHYHRLRRQQEIFKKYQSALKIQSAWRQNLAVNKANMIRTRQRFASVIKSTIKLQSCMRKFIARAQLSHNEVYIRAKCILVLQKWIKKCLGRVRLRRRCKSRHEGLMHSRLTSIQRYIRSFLAKRKVQRKKLRMLHDILFTSASKIQAWVRKLITPALLRKSEIKTNMSTFIHQHSMILFRLTPPITPSQASTQGTTEANTSVLSANMMLRSQTNCNIFTLATRGMLEELETIFQNQSVMLSSRSSPSLADEMKVDSSTALHHPYETNDAGDTILTIAASQGHIEIVRQCLRWGFDPNHRNKADYTALYLAVKNNHIQVMQYLLSLNSVTSITPIKQLQELSEDEVAQLLIAAVENSPTKGLGALTFLLSHGLFVDSVASQSGLTAYLVAVSLGNIDAVKLILQYEPSADIRDNKRQSLLHKACMSSLELVKVFLGEEDEMDNIYGSINTATGEDIVVHIFPEQALRLKDLEGKDCSSVAAIYGQSEILDYVRQRTFGMTSSQISPTHIGLSLNYDDMQMILNLAATNNVTCLSYVIQNLRFDCNTVDSGTGLTIALKAASAGSINVLEYLITNLAFKLDLSLVDVEGWNIFHHAALCADTGVISYLLRHRMISCCNVDDSFLAKGNNTKDTPLHIAIDTAAAVAMNTNNRKSPTYSAPGSPSFVPRSGRANENIALKSLLALLDEQCSSVMDALEKKNNDGFTLLQHACNLGLHDAILKLLALGADVTVMDSRGNTCLWLFLHSEHNPDILQVSKGGGYTQKHGVPSSRTASMSTRMRRPSRRSSINLARDVEVVIALVKADCPLYKFNKVTPERILSAVAGPGRLQLDSGDVIAQEKCYELLRQLPLLLQNIDCWRLVLSCIRFGVHATVAPLSPVFANLGGESEDVALSRPLLTLLESQDTVNILWSEYSSLIPTGNDFDVKRKVSFALSLDIVQKLQYAMFGGTTVLGWAVKLNNPHALSVLEREGLSLSAPVDVKGNTLLHVIAESQPTDNILKRMIDVILESNPSLVHATNKDGITPGMLCAKYGSNEVFKILYGYGCNPRISLKGKYCAWIVAYVKKYEQDECQRGVSDEMNFLDYM
jgi:ankyrin repeat protein